MEQAINEKPVGPWYRNSKYWSQIAFEYIRAYNNIPQNAKHHAEFKAFEQFMGYRLVFESNLIEGEGLSSGETIKNVKECFPSIPDSYEAIRKLAEIQKEFMADIINTNKYEDMVKLIEKYGLSKDKITPSIKFANKSSGYVEVVQHYYAYMEAQIIALKLLNYRYMVILKHVIKLIKLNNNKNEREK